MVFKIEDIGLISQNLRGVLEHDFNIKYIENIISDENASKDFSLSSDFIDLFKIEKSGSSIIMSIVSMESLSEVKENIVKNYDSFIKDFDDYFERVEDQLDGKNSKSFEIIGKTLRAKKKKLVSTISRFKAEDGWNVSEIQRRFFDLVRKSLSEIIYDIIRPIFSGLRECTAYQSVLEMFNRFLSKLGVYTMDLSSGKKLEESEWEYITPQENSDAETSDHTLKNVVKEVLSYPYVLAYGESEELVREGEVIMWKVTA